MNDYERGEEQIWRATEVNGRRTTLVPVGGLVRCKDCAHGTLSHQRGVPVVECHVMRSYNRPDGYCHLGERKEIANER